VHVLRVASVEELVLVAKRILLIVVKECQFLLNKKINQMRSVVEKNSETVELNLDCPRDE